MSYFWISAAALAICGANVALIVNQIRKRTLQKIAYLYVAQGALFGYQFIDTTFITYQNPEIWLTNLAYFFLASTFAILLISMVITRRRMHTEWLASQGSVTIPLYEATMNLAEATTTSLPFIIKTRTQWRLTFIIFAILIGITDSVGIVSLFQQGESDAITVLLAFLTLHAVLLVFIVPFASLLSAGRPRLTILPEEIQSRANGHTTRIRWEDIRLFVLIQKDQIELASANCIIRIPRLNRKSTYQPTVPFDDYTRLMDSLLLTIAERTGLSLTDLRDRTPF